MPPTASCNPPASAPAAVPRTPRRTGEPERAPQRETRPARDAAHGTGTASEAADTRRVLPRLVAMMPRSKYWRLPVFCLALAGGAGAAVVAPFLAGSFLFDQVLAPQGRFAGMVLLAVGLILLARLAEVGFSITWGWVNAAFIHNLEVTLKRTAFHSLQRLSMRFHTARHTGELMTRLEQDASDVALLFHIIAPSALHGGIFLAGSLAAMLLLDWQLAIAAILPFPLLLIAFRRILPEVNSYFDRLFRAEAQLRTVTSDSLTGARVVRAFGGQQRELARFAVPNRESARLGYLAQAMVGTTRPPMELVTELVLVGVWAAGAWAVVRGQVTVGLVVTFAAYLSRFFWPVGGLVDLAEDWGRVATAARRLLALIDARSDLPEPRQPRRISGARGGVALERVSFSYQPGQPAAARREPVRRAGRDDRPGGAHRGRQVDGDQPARAPVRCRHGRGARGGTRRARPVGRGPRRTARRGAAGHLPVHRQRGPPTSATPIRARRASRSSRPRWLPMPTTS